MKTSDFINFHVEEAIFNHSEKIFDYLEPKLCNSSVPRYLRLCCESLFFHGANVLLYRFIFDDVALDEAITILDNLNYKELSGVDTLTRRRIYDLLYNQKRKNKWNLK
jgi:hypothetical protein